VIPGQVNLRLRAQKDPYPDLHDERCYLNEVCDADVYVVEEACALTSASPGSAFSNAAEEETRKLPLVRASLCQARRKSLTAPSLICEELD